MLRRRSRRISKQSEKATLQIHFPGWPPNTGTHIWCSLAGTFHSSTAGTFVFAAGGTFETATALQNKPLQYSSSLKNKSSFIFLALSRHAGPDPASHSFPVIPDLIRDLHPTFFLSSSGIPHSKRLHPTPPARAINCPRQHNKHLPSCRTRSGISQSPFHLPNRW